MAVSQGGPILDPRTPVRARLSSLLNRADTPATSISGPLSSKGQLASEV